ncbi:MAG: polysaccharide biosynthesis tyrosine autokinase [Planctomycetota bacterium]|jgi:capsular exopolysaccharide synthesis family protein
MNANNNAQPPVGNGAAASGVLPRRPVTSSVPVALSPNAGEPKLRDYLRILGYHWKLLIVVGIMPVIGAAMYTLTRPKRYRARTVMVGADGPGVRSSVSDISMRMAVERINRGDSVLVAEAGKRVRAALEAESLAWDVPADGELAGLVRASVEGRGSELVVTAFLSQRRDLGRGSTTGRLAAILADSFAESLIVCADRERLRLLDRARGNIRSLLKAKEEQGSRLSTRIIQRRAELDTGDEVPPLPSAIEKVRARMDALEREKQSAEFSAKQLEEEVAELKRSVQKTRKPGSKNLQLVELNKALIRTEMALVQARLKYKENHPTTVRLRAERKALEEKLKAHHGEGASSEMADAARLQARLEVAQAQLTGAKARCATVRESLNEESRKYARVMLRLKAEGVDEEFDRLVRERQVLEASISALQRELENVDENDVSAPLPRLQVLSRAAAPSEPYSPRWAVNLAVGLGLAMVLVLVVAFISENLEERIRDQRDLVQHLDLPFLGPIPFWREGEGKLIDLDRPRSVTASVHEVLRNNISYALPPGAPKVLLVASSVQGEGKSTIAANLAISYCLDGNNVLLVDTDLRRPRAHRLFESLCPQASNSEGLTGYLSGRIRLEEALFQASVPGLSIIVAGHGAKNPSKLLGSPEMRALVAELTAAFDVVILDGPAVLPVVDSTVVSSLASGVLLVVAAKCAPAEQIATAVARLEHVQAPLIGVVLNRQPSGYRGYQYYGSPAGYGTAYTYGPDENAEA